MRRINALAALALATFGLMGAAHAADMAVKAPVPAITPYNWAGFHIGLSAGYGWSGDNSVANIGLTPPYLGAVGTAIPAAINSKNSGFIGGIQWGTDWQNGRWVFGTESDFSGTGFDNTTSVVTPGATGRVNTIHTSLDWFSTTRLRLGYTVQDNVLLYATGGLADGSAKLSASNFTVAGPCGVAGNCPFGSKTDTLWGWTLGGGLEWGSGPWSAKIEYLHYDLGNVTLVYGDGLSPGLISANKNFSGDIVRGGVNYRFPNWNPWQLIFGR
jgi:outer membrane immunogenic protein